MQNDPLKFRDAGYSIVELMVAMSIGLVITGAIGSLYVGSRQTFVMQNDASQLQDTSRAAFDILGYHLRQAGFVDVADDSNRLKILLNAGSHDWLQKRDPTNKKDMIATFFDSSAPYVGIQAIKGCDGLPASLSNLKPPWACGSTGASSVIVSYQALPTDIDGKTVRPANTYLDTLGAYNATTGVGGDCGAKDVAGGSANPKGPLAINLFYVDAASSRLKCVGSGDPASPRVIAEGVEDMALLYGITPTLLTASDPMDAYAGRYVSASNVTDWSKVLSVRVCLQIASPSKNMASSVASYTNCWGASQPQSDGKIRQMHRATFSLRNNVLTSPDALP
jgi:type IV pilus assembly protein PilW